MNAKEVKFLELFEEFSKIDILENKLALSKSLKSFMTLDYNLAVNVWEFLACAKEHRLAKEEKFAELVGFEFLNLFSANNATKTAKVLADVPSVRRAVYQYSKNAGQEKSLQVLVDYLVAGKVLVADEIFKVLAKNQRIHYGQAMKRVLERVFIELLKKNPSKIEMNKKLADLFLVYIAKVKTEEKAMLEQRIKETR